MGYQVGLNIFENYKWKCPKSKALEKIYLNGEGPKDVQSKFDNNVSRSKKNLFPGVTTPDLYQSQSTTIIHF